MKFNSLLIISFSVCISLFASSCDFLFGTRKDATTADIFQQGAIDPNLYPSQVGYVPLLPFWKNIPHPVDVYVGYDEMVYVCDDNGLDIFDLKGTLQRNIPIPGATDVIQDRHLDTYVCGRVDKVVSGTTYNLAAVYHISNASTASQPVIIDTLIHPFCDVSRNNSSFRGATDEAVKFTGLATRADNTIYVSRSGPTNDLSSVARPDNTILIFDSHGNNTYYSNGLNSVSSSLKSCLDVTGIAGFAAPPQVVNGMSTSHDFILAQGDSNAQFNVLWIKEYTDPDLGVAYGENASLVNFDYSKADQFLYQPYRFSHPADVYVAPDATQYIFVVDDVKDSLYQFTPKGFEGVNPPANSTFTKQINCSFGGAGSGPYQFLQPSGVCYFRKVIYVADKNNNRICRYVLSTDLE